MKKWSFLPLLGPCAILFGNMFSRWNHASLQSSKSCALTRNDWLPQPLPLKNPFGKNGLRGKWWYKEDRVQFEYKDLAIELAIYNHQLNIEETKRKELGANKRTSSVRIYVNVKMKNGEVVGHVHFYLGKLLLIQVQMKLKDRRSCNILTRFHWNYVIGIDFTTLIFKF